MSIRRGMGKLSYRCFLKSTLIVSDAVVAADFAIVFKIDLVVPR